MNNTVISEGGEARTQTSTAREGPARPGWEFGRESTVASRRRVPTEFFVGGPMLLVGAVAGIGAFVLAILSLARVAPAYFVPIGIIVLGGGLLAISAAILSRYWEPSLTLGVSAWPTVPLAFGIFVDLVAGAGGIILGILALLGYVPRMLVSIAVLTVGAAWLLSTGMTHYLTQMEPMVIEANYPWAGRFIRRLPTSVQFLSGLATVVLGVLALVGVVRLTLVMVAILILGVSFFLSSVGIRRRAGNMPNSV
jgi:hypothetical protein